MAIPSTFRRSAAPLTGTDAPEPGWLAQAGASLRRTLDRQDIPQEHRYDREYAALIDGLADLGYDRRSFYRRQAARDRDLTMTAKGENLPAGGVMRVDTERVWATVLAERTKDRRRFAGLPDTREEFEQWVARRKGGAEDDARTLARGTGISAFSAQLAGGAVGSFAEPINVLTAPIGGGARTVAGTIVAEMAINAGATALTLPASARNAERMGETFTAGDAALEVGAAAIGGGVLAGIGKGIVEPLARRIAGSPARGAMTLDERAAVDVTAREEEIDESSPFVTDGAGDTQHRERLSSALAAVLDGVRPAPFVAAPSANGRRARLLAGTRGQSIGGTSLDTGIVDFFVGKGYSAEQARGIAAGIAAESRNAHGIVNPTSGAYGLGQWLGPRKAELFRRYGPNPTREQQLEYLHWELQGGDHGGRAVLSAKGEAAALDAYIRRFMRPAPGRETAGDLERGMAALGREGESPPMDGAFPEALAAMPPPEPPPAGPDIGAIIARGEDGVPEGAAIDGVRARDVLDDIAKNVPERSAAAERRNPRRNRPSDVIEFLTDRGGLRDDEGHDLRRGRGFGTVNIFRSGRLIRGKGMSIDAAGELLHEAGYFIDRPTSGEVLDLLERAVNGSEKVYSRFDESWVAARGLARRDAADAAAQVAARDATIEALGDWYDPEMDTDLIDDVTVAMRDGEDAFGALERLVIERSRDALARSGESADNGDYGWPDEGIPFFDAVSAAPEGGGGRAPAGASAGRARATGEADGSAGGGADALAAEPEVREALATRRDAPTYADELEAWDDPDGEAAQALADSGIHDLRARATEAEADPARDASYRIDDGEGQSLTAIVDDIDEDEAMLAAIKSCL